MWWWCGVSVLFPAFRVPVWFLGWVLLGWCGRGVRSSSVTCPCCCSRALPVGLRPWLRFSLRGFSVGFSFPCLAWLLVAPGRPLAFPRLVCFFPFVSSNYTIVLRFFALLFWFFVLSKGYQLLARRAWAHAHLVRLKSSCPRLCCNVIT